MIPAFSVLGPFLHDVSCNSAKRDMSEFPLEPETSVAEAQPAHRSSAPRSSIPCRYFQRGGCYRGDQCTFLHSSPEGVGAPSEKEKQEVSGEPQDRHQRAEWMQSTRERIPHSRMMAPTSGRQGFGTMPPPPQSTFASSSATAGTQGLYPRGGAGPERREGIERVPRGRMFALSSGRDGYKLPPPPPANPDPK
jgi:hypothetical protein